MPGAWIENLTSPEAGTRLRAGAIVVVPVGAAAKAHGPHLPLDTDRTLARALAEGVARELPVLVAPVIDFGWYPAFTGYPGSQSIRAETFVALVVEIVEKLVRDGARHVAVVNTGVSTEAPLAIAAREVLDRTGVAIEIADIRHLGRETDALLEQRSGGHADEHETSLMLAVDPARVRMARAESEERAPRPPTVFRHPTALRDDPAAGEDYSRTGATGDPTRASAAKGEAILAAMIRDLVDGLRTRFPDADGVR